MKIIRSNQIPSPCYIIDEQRLKANLEKIKNVSTKAGVKIIPAFKAFATWQIFPLIRPYVTGAAASSLNEVLLCHKYMKAPAHTYAVAYAEYDFDKILKYSSHITFNSLSQFEQFGKKAMNKASCGLRVNPEWSDVQTELYNPAHETSRLGITAEHFPDELPAGIEGLHFHVLCESSAESLVEVLKHFEKKFGKHLPQLKWVNMGGGHLMTRDGYNEQLLIDTLKSFKEKHQVEIILEPGSAFVWQAGDLHTTVQDVVENGGIKTAILDVSFTCHMPDTLEMPYRPEIKNAYDLHKSGTHPYRLGGISCLAGDYLDAYYFTQPLQPGDKVIFKDMIHYTMVKTTHFNGVAHPGIGIRQTHGGFRLLRKFTFYDYKKAMN